MEQNVNQLIEQCKQNDTAAREWLYKTYAPTMLGVCLRYIKNRQEAEDVLHESFITVFEKINQLKVNNAIEGWLRRIVVNNALRFLNTKNYDWNIDDIKTDLSDSETVEPQGVKEQILGLEITRENMLSLVNEMPVGFRTVFNLYVFEKLKHSEIAKQLSISEGTSKSQLLRARKLLQKKLHNLVLDTQKKKKKEKVYLSSFLLVMNDDLNYIDKLAQSKLEGFSVPPISGAGFIAQTASLQSGSAVAVKSKLFVIMSKKIVWLTSAIVATAGISTMLLLNKPKPTQIIEHEVPVIVFNDSVENVIPDVSMESVIVKQKKTIVARKKIISKKKIVVTIPDTVKVKQVE